MLAQRLRVAEAMLLLLLARLLITRFRFGLWRSSLGRLAFESRCCTPTQNEQALAQACAHAVRRAAVRLPGSLCLAQAMALQWMLRWRGMATLLLGAAPQHDRRGGLDDLHAWVEWRGIALLDDGDGLHRPACGCSADRWWMDGVHCSIDSRAKSG